MATVFAKHTVEDYDSWRAKFDEHAGVREKYGCKGNDRLYREAGKPNGVVIMNEWESMEGIEQFMEEGDVQSAMMESGVISEPELYFLEAVEAKTPERPSA